MNINKIIEKLSTDKEIAEKYAGIKGIDEILAQAKADGFDVTREDVQAVLSKLGGKSGKSEELSEDELAVVAGGTGDKNTCGKCGGAVGQCPCYNCAKCRTLMQHRKNFAATRYMCPACGYDAIVDNGHHIVIKDGTK